MNHIHYQLALDRRDDLLREANDQRRARDGAASTRIADLRLRILRPAPTSRRRRRHAAAQNET